MNFDFSLVDSKNTEIPVYILFRALNIENDVDIKNIINPQ